MNEHSCILQIQTYRRGRKQFSQAASRSCIMTHHEKTSSSDFHILSLSPPHWARSLQQEKTHTISCKFVLALVNPLFRFFQKQKPRNLYQIYLTLSGPRLTLLLKLSLPRKCDAYAFVVACNFFQDRVCTSSRDTLSSPCFVLQDSASTPGFHTTYSFFIVTGFSI